MVKAPSPLYRNQRRLAFPQTTFLIALKDRYTIRAVPTNRLQHNNNSPTTAGRCVGPTVPPWTMVDEWCMEVNLGSLNSIYSLFGWSLYKSMYM